MWTSLTALTCQSRTEDSLRFNASILPQLPPTGQQVRVRCHSKAKGSRQETRDEAMLTQEAFPGYRDDERYSSEKVEDKCRW